MRDLAELVQSLPRELYDEILDLTLTPDTNVVIINQNYQPPAQLHVSQACRRTFQARYYKNTAFAVEVWYGIHLIRLARSLTPSAARKVVCINVKTNLMTMLLETGLQVMERVAVCRPNVLALKGRLGTSGLRYSCIAKENDGRSVLQWLADEGTLGDIKRQTP